MRLCYIQYNFGKYFKLYCEPFIRIISMTRHYCYVESTSLILIQRRNNVVCPVGVHGIGNCCDWAYFGGGHRSAIPKQSINVILGLMLGQR